MSTEHQSPLHPVKSQHHQLIEYLDEFGKQISSRKTSNSLEGQLSNLSRAYNQAQEKLLQTETALMNESLQGEKQRAIIEIYKNILRENMEDEGILCFIQALEEEEEKQYIYEELEEIRNLLSKKRASSFKKNIEEQRTVKDLKKEISRLHDERSNICDQSQLINSENYDLRIKLEEIQSINEQLKAENMNLKRKLIILEDEMTKMKENLHEKLVQISQLQSKNEELSHLQQELQQIHQVIGSKLLNQKQNYNPLQSKQSKMNSNSIQTAISQLLKYKVQYKKLKQSFKNNDFMKKQLSLVKFFLSEEALKLLKEYEEQKMECIEGELRNLAALEKNKLIRLEETEREVWKYKLQLMKEEENSHNYHIPNFSVTQSLKPSEQYSISENYRLISSVPLKETPATEEKDCISEFGA